MLGLDLDSWNLVMVLSLGFAAIAAFAVVVSTAMVIKLQKAVEQETRLEFDRYKIDADKRIAESNARTKEAELKLEQLRKQLGPRHLQRDIFIEEISGQPMARAEIMYLQDDPECFDLAQQIWRALEDGKWPVDPPKPIPSLILSDGPTPMSVGGQPSGVTVVVREITHEESEASTNALFGREWVRTPWTVITHALGASIGKVSGHAGGQNSPPVGTVRVVVAPRL